MTFREHAGTRPQEPRPGTDDPDCSLTQNGRFYEAARRARDAGGRAELVRVYEKVRTGIWVFNGTLRLLDAWAEEIGGRRVFKFRLEVTESNPSRSEEDAHDLDATRVIPTAVKLEVWKRDKGRCVECGSSVNLHFDHIIPWSRGGTSLTRENIQLLCARHNLAKHDRIQ